MWRFSLFSPDCFQVFVCVCVCVRESSGRHYIQSGRQLLIAQQLPGEVTDLARRIERVGLESLLARDLRARLR